MAESKEDGDSMSFPEGYNFNKESLNAYSQGLNNGFKNIEAPRSQSGKLTVSDVGHVDSDDIFNA